MTRLVLALLAIAALAGTAFSQERAALIADRISVVAGNELRAEGNVEVLYQGMRLRASAITYNAARDRITIEGPMTLVDGEDLILIADSGELDADFQNGLLEGARLVLAQQLQVAAAEMQRVDGRYTQLFRAVASTCQVCSTSETPLWQIRASRAIHDQELKRMYYYDAVFEVAGLPVFYVPRLRMPDATVDRASGFLLPRLSKSTALGTGVKLPYFIALSDHSDMTLTGFATKQTNTLGVEYRRLLKNGAISFAGAVSDDTLIEEYLRGFLFARGVFFLPRDFELSFDLEMSSDDSYLFDYGISTQDRLRSDVALTRVRRSSYTSATASQFVSFRDSEVSGTTPALTGQLDQIRSFHLPILGGQARYRLQGFGLIRSSEEDIVGRDYARFSAGLDWHRSAVVGPGFVLSGAAQLSFDSYDISQDSTFEDQATFTSAAGITLSWPQQRLTPGGAREVLEPKLQFVFSNAETASVPNEESTLVEFDEGSLWSLDRLPGSSSYETGHRLNAGVTWTRQNPNGLSAMITFGRVLRLEEDGQFNEATGLSGTTSDWLLAGQAEVVLGISGMTRILLNDEMDITRNDTRLAFERGKIGLDASFLWQIAEPEVGRDQDTWELNLGARFPLSRNWRAAADLRYDFVADRAASAGMNLIYQGQCVDMNIGATRTFTSSESVDPQTEITISLSVPQGAVASNRPNLQCGG